MNLRHTFNKVTLFISLAKLITFCFIMISQSLQKHFYLIDFIYGINTYLQRHCDFPDIHLHMYNK